MALVIAPGTTKIGWIGTGVMGSSMCGHLIDAGYSATVFSRTKSKTESLVAKGATWAESPKAVADASDVIFGISDFLRTCVKSFWENPEHWPVPKKATCWLT